MNDFSSSVEGTTAADVMELLLMTQYFDVVRDVGKSGTNTLFLPHGPKSVKQLRLELQDSFHASQQGQQLQAMRREGGLSK